MYCRSCGAENFAHAYRCVRCGAALEPVAPARVENHLVFAILVTAFCCMPFGLVAVIYAAQVNSLAHAGNLQAAEDSAKKAQIWSLVSLVVGLLSTGAYVVYAVVIAIMDLK